MTTTRKAESNRRNALLSTGPRTKAGKAKVAGNRLSHGLRATKQVVLRGEDAAAFEALARSLAEHLAPSGPLEAELVHRIATGLWRLRRAGIIEVGILDGEIAGDEARAAAVEAQACMVLRDEVKELLGPSPLEPRWEVADADGHREACKRGEEHRRDTRTPEALLGGAFGRAGASLTILSRYETSLDRGVVRALRELDRLRRARAVALNGKEAPPLAD